MSILMMLATGAKKPLQPFSQTFTSNGVWIGDASSVNMSGYGARGADATPASWTSQQVRNSHRRTGSFDSQGIGSRSGVGAKPADYCGNLVQTPSDPVYDYYQDCEYFTAVGGSPATTGASATGLGRTFPGSLGNTTPAVTTFQNVPAVVGTSYNIVVPTGGSITLNWLK